MGDHGHVNGDPAQLHTPRLLLRMVTPADIDAVATLSCDPQVNQHSPSGAPSREQAAASARSFIDDWQRYGIGYWIVEHDRQMIGIAGIKPAELDGTSYWNLYYRFSPSVWGQGFAAEATTAALQVARERAPERRALARTRPGNTPAARLALSIGMQREPALDADGFITFATP